MKSNFRDWSNIRFFLAVFRAGSTLAASKTLGAAQPTVARRIEALEHELGLVLFERDTRGFRPTEAARSLVPVAEEIEAATDAFAAKAQDLTIKRAIRITAPAANFSPRMNKIVYAFSLRHPDIGFEFLPAYRTLDLMAGEADIALRLTRDPPSDRLICRKISTARSALYGSRAYSQKRGLPDAVQEMHQHSFITYRPDEVIRAEEHWMLKHVPPDRIVRSYAEFEMLRAAVSAGLGLGILNMKNCEGDANLIPCIAPIEELDLNHLMLIAPQAYRRPEVRQFVRFFGPRYAAIYR